MSYSNISALIEQYGPNSGFIKDLYDQFLVDPTLVPAEWAAFFNGATAGRGITAVPAAHGVASAVPAVRDQVSSAAASANADLVSRVGNLVSAYRCRGHLKAKTNPLVRGVAGLPVSDDLNPEYHSLSADDLDAMVPNFGIAGLDASVPLATLIAQLESTYCSSIGFQYEHITTLEEREWLRERIEARGVIAADADESRAAFRRVAAAETVEKQFFKKYIGKKWFSLEGAESLIPLLDSLIEQAASEGTKEAFIGMAHRGRLNVLINILGKPLAEIFSEFEEEGIATVIGSGDVKYHLGRNHQYETRRNGTVSITLAPNPSHLEFVNSVVEGMVRSRQDLVYGQDRNSVLPILLHGDAAFIGQGVVYETINLSRLAGYRTGGSIHVVINNQIGFTTTTDEYRSAIYCTDMASGFDIPVFHVNSEDIDACLWVAKLATEYRNRFGRDAIVDFLCYRKYGHNEADDPSFTQPLMYAEISEKKSIANVYADVLVERGVISREEVKECFAEYRNAFDEADRNRPVQLIGEACATYGRLRVPTPETGVPAESLHRIARLLTDYPEGFAPHPKLHKIIEKRVEAVVTGGAVEWGLSEGLAFGSLLLDGVSVRLSGQDCARGTFSQRHLIFDHHEGREAYSPLQRLTSESPGTRVELLNSSLSEAAVVGYEFGYSSLSPRSLVIWEGQFGDFGNGAQVFIDQFLSSSEAKWDMLSGLTMMLPHGYEGMGPEHSSARLERYLQLCAEGNMVVCYPTSSAQHFHLLRRQGIMELKRPLIIMTPKSLLRFPPAASPLSEFTSGHFHTILEHDMTPDSSDPQHVVMCSGKVYYDISTALTTAAVKNVKIIRIEQLYPFPQFEIKKALRNMNAQRYLWVQEEPQNMGSWTYIEPYLRHKIGVEPHYVGRPVSASTAAGSAKRHAYEQKKLLDEMLELVR